jgi:hypothetical protein
MNYNLYFDYDFDNAFLESVEKSLVEIERELAIKDSFFILILPKDQSAYFHTQEEECELEFLNLLAEKGKIPTAMEDEALKEKLVPRRMGQFFYGSRRKAVFFRQTLQHKH